MTDNPRVTIFVALLILVGLFVGRIYLESEPPPPPEREAGFVPGTGVDGQGDAAGEGAGEGEGDGEDQGEGAAEEGDEQGDAIEKREMDIPSVSGGVQKASVDGFGRIVSQELSLGDVVAAEDPAITQLLDPLTEELEAALKAASPLTPRSYKQTLKEHRDVPMEVLKKSSELAKIQGAEAGHELLQAYNARMDTYKAQAYANAD